MTATLPSPLFLPTLFCATRKQHASNEQGLHVEISGQQYEMRRHLPKNWQDEHPVLLLGPNTGENLQEKKSMPKKTIYETCWS